jgi:dipeptidyl aminopeptidase/acylaminoacyl peptidase
MHAGVRYLFSLWALLCVTAIDATPSSLEPRVENVLLALNKGRSIEQTQLSPDGKWLAWVMTSNAGAIIEVAAPDGTGAHRLNAIGNRKGCSESDIAWAPDSRHLAYIDRCGTENSGAPQTELKIVAVEGADHLPRRVTLHGNARALIWSPDGHHLGFLYVPGATRQASSSAAAKPSLNEVGVNGLEVQQVAVLDTTASAPFMATARGTYVYEFSWSPDGKQITYVAAPPPGDDNWWVAKLYKKAVDSDSPAQLLVDPAKVQGSLHGLQIAVPRWSPDASRIVFIGGLMSGMVGGDIYSVPSDGGTVVNLTPAAHVTPVWLTWSGANSLWVSQISDGRSQVVEYRVASDKAAPGRIALDVPASIGDGSAYMALSLSRDATRAAYIQSSYTRPPEVYAGVLGLTSAVTAFNADLKPVWGKTESVVWKNDGYRAQGWLMYPAHYDPAKRYPMVVIVHGGPANAVVPYWPGISFSGGALFSSAGYFVFMPNPRGSLGEGERYVQANRRDFGGGDLDDILAGMDAIEKKLPIDDHRIGLMGWSYGGFMSMFAPTRTSRFRAVVAGAGIADWESYYGQNQIDKWTIPYFGASVYDDPAAYAKISAINFIKRYRTPTLLLVGDSDEECPSWQSLEFWHALRAENVPTSLIVYPNEGHAFADPQHRIDLLRRSLKWLEQYVPSAGP